MMRLALGGETNLDSIFLNQNENSQHEGESL
jgi:hypothetical protein